MGYIVNSLHVVEVQRYYHYLHSKEYVFHGHRHGGYEINLILSGEMEVTCAEHIVRVKAGQLVLIPPFRFHQNRVLGSQSCEMVVVQFVSPEIAEQQCAVFELESEAKCLVQLFCADVERWGQVEAGRCLQLQDSGRKLLEVILQYAFYNRKAASEIRNEENQIYQHAIGFMLQNIHRDIYVEELARECGVCATSIKKVFSYFTGRGCIAYFNELKLEIARRKLEEGIRCGDVATALGFSSQAYFSKRFKMFFGVSPSVFRRNGGKSRTGESL